MFSLEAIRKQSLETANKLGYPINESLPFLDAATVIRSCDEIIDRTLAMLCVAACAYGFDSQKASEWLARETKDTNLTPSESRFLQNRTGNPRTFMERIEGIWALAWSIGVVPDLDFGKPCATNFVLCLPDLKGNKSSAAFRENCMLRPHEQVVSACDLAYCLHWAIRELKLKGMDVPNAVAPYVIIERRHALEWLLTSVDWDDVTLDT